MRIISWNVNGIRATTNKGELQNLILSHDPDILFMQEIKAGHDKLTPELKYPDPYVAHYNPAEKPGYAGTGAWIHSRVYENYDIEFMDSFPEDPTTNEGRVAHVCLKMRNVGANNLESGILNLESDIHLFGIYFPNGGKSEQAWQDKLVFYTKFAKYMDELRDTGASVIWGGDINCAHHAIDLARPEANDGKIGFHPLERAWLDGRVSDGWQDLWRMRNPEMTEVYSWWDPVTRSRERNVGWRIDALWGDQSIIEKVRNIEYLQNQMGSDHCPILIDLSV